MCPLICFFLKKSVCWYFYWWVNMVFIVVEHLWETYVVFSEFQKWLDCWCATVMPVICRWADCFSPLKHRQGADFCILPSGILITWDCFSNCRMRACYKNVVLGIVYILDYAFNYKYFLRKFKVILKLNYISLLRTVQTLGKIFLGQVWTCFLKFCSLSRLR